MLRLNDHMWRKTAVIDHMGGKLAIDGTNASLKIPAGAMHDGQEVQLTISLHWGNLDRPALGSNQFLVGPYMHCEPEGIRFSKPVTLTIPQSSASTNEEHIRILTKTSKLTRLIFK